MKKIFLDISGRTDLGTSRELNEDSCITALGQQGTVEGVRAVLAVSDGMGGHDAGDVASKIACEYLEHLFAKGNYVRLAQEWEMAADDYPALLREAFATMNRKIMERARSFNLLRTMGCTCVVCLVAYDKETDQWKLVIGSIGDSRCYLIRGGEILLATEDDSVVWQLYKQKEITYAEMRLHPKRNVLTQALGIQETIRPSVRVLDLQEDDTILLCSDGLHGTVSEEDIREVVVSSRTSDEAVEALTELGNRLGSRDNIAVAVARCAGEPARTESAPKFQLVRTLLIALPVVMLGVGSVVLLNSSPGNPELEIPVHTVAIRSASPSAGSAGGLTVEFSLQPYAAVARAREQYAIVRTLDNVRDTIPLARVKEQSPNVFQIPCETPPDWRGPVRLTLLHTALERPLYESTLMVEARPHQEQPTTEPHGAMLKRPERVAEAAAPPIPVVVSRGQDGYLQVKLTKDFDIQGEATAEVSMDGVVEILTLMRQNRTVPKSTSLEYRVGEMVQFKLIGTPHTWKTTLQ